MASNALELDDLTVTYISRTRRVAAVRNVNLTVKHHEIVGLVGESGSGKSTLAFAVMRLLTNAQVTGRVSVGGQDILSLDPEALRRFRWNTISMAFQSAMNALNPVMPVWRQIADTLKYHQPHLSDAEVRQRIKELADLVRIDPARLQSYPHELSGGMRQRVVIAIAIALHPSVVIMDEPTTALDVVVQRSLLENITAIQEQTGFSIIFISHDLSLVTELADRIAIMYAGRIVELTPAATAVQPDTRHHPYTQGLLAAIPRLSDETVVIRGIPGNPPDMAHLPSGCPFAPRCPQRMDRCQDEEPALRAAEIGQIACHLFD